MQHKTIAGFLIFILCGTLCFAQNQENMEAAVPSGEAAASLPQVSMDEEGMVSLDFRNADIHNVFKILSLKSGVNIVAGPEVAGMVTIQLNSVPWQQALDVILQTYGYAYERKGNIISVTTIEKLKKRREDANLLADQEQLVTKTFTLNFAKASTVINSLMKMKSQRGNIDFDDRTNTLIVTDLEAQIDLMGEVIKKLDTTTPQVLIEAKIVETSFSDTENLGIDWVVQASLSGSSRGISWPFKKGRTDNFYAGSDNINASGAVTYGTLSFTEVSAVFEVLKSRSDTNILSAPRIVTLDNQPAEITIGEQYPLPTYTYNEDQAKLQVSGWSYKDIGIIFKVTPHVNDAGYVTLDLQPTITAITGSVTVESTSVPQLSNESAKTTVMIKSGETLVIGGLIKSQKTDTKKKVPIIGDIPIVGMAFKKTEKSGTKTDLLIFMTPHIITPVLEQETKG
ncbi:MAG: type IV pilus secretin PilQ [Candidatus Omnitrophica bacterium]|nr:type IV pilus secretin PilQ [Candidatus Omnitrophota bacterium]